MARSKSVFSKVVIPAFTATTLAEYNAEHGTKLAPGDKDPRPGREGKRIRKFRVKLTSAQKAERQRIAAVNAAARAAESTVEQVLSKSVSYQGIAQGARFAAANLAECDALLNHEKQNEILTRLRDRIEAREDAIANAPKVKESIRAGAATMVEMRNAIVKDCISNILTGEKVNVASLASKVDDMVDSMPAEQREFLSEYRDAFPILHGAEDDSEDADGEDNDDDDSNE